MSEPFYVPNRRPDPPRQPKPGELLFTCTRASDDQTIRCELRDHGVLGIEAQVSTTAGCSRREVSIHGSTRSGRRASWRSRGRTKSDG